MCGIFGYVGPSKPDSRGNRFGDAAKVVAAGLKRLEYRGYDSWGIALAQSARISNFQFPISNKNGKILIEKHVGAIGESTLSTQFSALSSSTAIGHTRWATHGGVTEKNAHPHFASDKSFALAQNGIVENYTELKTSLSKKGYKFETETDTEVIVRLIEEKLKNNVILRSKTEESKERFANAQDDKFREAVREAFLELEGRNTIILISKDGRVVAARNGSPLVIGRNFETGEIYLSSDTLSFAPYAKKMIIVDNGQLVEIKDKDLKIFDIKTGKELKREFEDIGIEAEKIDKEGFDHFMLKEIYESPSVVEQLINQDRKIFEDFAKVIGQAKRVYTVGVGTIGVAAAQIAFYLRTISKINAVSLTGPDCVEYMDLFEKGDLIIAPSQSGETADVLEVLEKAKKKGVAIASLVNMPGSSMTRLSDYKFMMQAGPEICVMSTKAFTSPISWGYLLAKTIKGEYQEGVKNLKNLAIEMDKWLKKSKNHKEIKLLAKKLVGAKDIFLLGKYQNLQIVREGMVKLIEGSYKHAHALPSGDLKHYVITLIEKGVPVIVAISEDKVKADLLNAVHEVKARGAQVVGIATKSEPDFDTFIPVPDCGEPTAIMNVIPLQLLAYYLAVEMGNNVDHPRNIAKSVTVK